MFAAFKFNLLFFNIFNKLLITNLLFSFFDKFFPLGFFSIKSKSLEYISKHYDLGNDFFSNWLDKTLTYSSAIYENKNDNPIDGFSISYFNKFCS